MINLSFHFIYFVVGTCILKLRYFLYNFKISPYKYNCIKKLYYNHAVVNGLFLIITISNFCLLLGPSYKKPHFLKCMFLIVKIFKN